MSDNQLKIIRLEEILPDLKNRPKTLESVIIEQESQKIAMQAIKNIVEGLQHTIHRLTSKGVDE